MPQKIDSKLFPSINEQENKSQRRKKWLSFRWWFNAFWKIGRKKKEMNIQEFHKNGMETEIKSLFDSLITFFVL